MSTGTTEQQEAIEDLDWDWLIIHDAGRADVFEEFRRTESLGPRLIDGDFQRVDNGGIGFTATWFQQHFPGEYDAMFFHGGQPIGSMSSGEYDGRDHFAVVPGATEYHYDEQLGTVRPDDVLGVVQEYLDGAVQERLEALGYVSESPPDRGVIRFLQPHAPFRHLVDATKGRANRVSKTAKMVRSGELSTDTLRDAYVDNYRWVLEKTIPFLEQLDGTIVVTADHGECLGDCGQFYHSGAHDMHTHLRKVPWWVIER